MKFLKALRTRPSKRKGSLVPDPMMPNFNKNAFHQAFMLYNDGSPEDTSAMSLGLLIGERVSRIFATLSNIESQTRACSYNEGAESVANFLNHQ